MTAVPRKSPTIFRELSRQECLALLATHDSGRLAFTFNDRVDIEPLNYILVDGDLVFRTTPGSKVDVLQNHPWVAFEVDQIEGRVMWTSVVSHGTIYAMDRAGSSQERREYEVAVERLRAIAPTRRRDDPGERHEVLLRLRVQCVTGREARAG